MKSKLLIACLATVVYYQTPVLAASQKIVAPTSGAYHGAFASFGLREDNVSKEKILEFESKSKKRLAWSYFSNHWLDGVIRFPKENVEICRRLGTIPYIRLQPWSRIEQDKPEPIFSMQAIIDGTFDEPLRAWAIEARDARTPIMIEFGPEVNGDWFPWSGKWNGGAETTRYGDKRWPDGPERFRDAYRHIIELFRDEGANNITWVLHVDTQWNPTQNWNKLKYYYPGDSYIDWIGLSVFGPQLLSHDWDPFEVLVKNFWPQIDEVTKSKPILISEYASIESPTQRNRKAKWIKDALESISSGRFPRVKGATYWNSAGWSEDPRLSFEIDTSLESLTAYRAEIAKPFWLERALISK